MELLKTSSVQSLLDSDLESVGSLHCLDIEELDEIEYALPASEAPTLEEVLSTEDEEEENYQAKCEEEPATCSALQVDFLLAVSQQIKQAQERSSAGAATALGVGIDGKITIGTAQGQLLSFHDQTLRWVCNSNIDSSGAIASLAYNKDGTRLLAGYARGIICQYESTLGVILRRITLGGEMWGILRVTWAATSGLALDTGGSVWLIKFSRPLGVRSARTSCLFSGARGEVVTMSARCARVLALATLTRVIVVAGGRAAGLRLTGPPETLPLLEWSETDERVLVCARATTLQWLSLNITGSCISIKLMQRIELKTIPLWMGWLGGSLAIFDRDENIRLLGDDYEKPLELSDIEPVYASAFFKGHWTEGRVSRAMCVAGGSALAGACVTEGALCLLGRRGVVRVRPRDLLSRAQAFFAAGRHLQALRLLTATRGSDAKTLAIRLVVNISERSHILSNKNVAEQVVKLCVKYDLSDELWTTLWEQCSCERPFVEALGDAVVRGELVDIPPSPDSTQALIERLADFEPTLVERVVASLPLTSLDPHRASVFTREKGLWRGVGAIAAAIGGWSEALRELSKHVSVSCSVSSGGVCTCAGSALVLAAADALAGRAAGGRALPDHRRPSARHDALHALLDEGCGAEGGEGSVSPLRTLVSHEASSALRLLEQCAHEPPFAGPLAKHNRLRVARALLSAALHADELDRLEILEFLTGQLKSGALPPEQALVAELFALAGGTQGERADRAWLALRARVPAAAPAPPAPPRPRLLWRSAEPAPSAAIVRFLDIRPPSESDLDDLFAYLRAHDAEAPDRLVPHLAALAELRPCAAAALRAARDPSAAAAALRSAAPERALLFGESLRSAGLLRAEASSAHLRLLCALRPAAVRAFLAEEPGRVRPEEALEAVREAALPDAGPLALCLEATGDPSAALDALLHLAPPALEEAGALCARASPSAPPPLAADMWARLLRAAGDSRPALLLDALAYLPPEEALERACASRALALAMTALAAHRARMWASCVRAAGRETHAGLARALSAAGRALAVRGACVRCGRALALSERPVRTLHCARAAHADCAPEPCCGACGRCVPEHAMPLPPRMRRTDPPPPSDDFDLALVAPPRPDLEGVV